MQAACRRTIRCNVSNSDVFQDWFAKHSIEDVEAFVPDMAGSARGKGMPAKKFGQGQQAFGRGQQGLDIQVYTDQDEEDRDEEAETKCFQLVDQWIIFRAAQK